MRTDWDEEFISAEEMAQEADEEYAALVRNFDWKAWDAKFNADLASEPKVEDWMGEVE
jgi:hypothetical protein